MANVDLGAGAPISEVAIDAVALVRASMSGDSAGQAVIFAANPDHTKLLAAAVSLFVIFGVRVLGSVDAVDAHLAALLERAAAVRGAGAPEAEA